MLRNTTPSFVRRSVRPSVGSTKLFASLSQTKTTALHYCPLLHNSFKHFTFTFRRPSEFSTMERPELRQSLKKLCLSSRGCVTNSLYGLIRLGPIGYALSPMMNGRIGTIWLGSSWLSSTYRRTLIEQRKLDYLFKCHPNKKIVNMGVQWLVMWKRKQ